MFARPAGSGRVVGVLSCFLFRKIPVAALLRQQGTSSRHTVDPSRFSCVYRLHCISVHAHCDPMTTSNFTTSILKVVLLKCISRYHPPSDTTKKYHFSEKSADGGAKATITIVRPLSANSPRSYSGLSDVAVNQSFTHPLLSDKVTQRRNNDTSLRVYGETVILS